MTDDGNAFLFLTLMIPGADDTLDPDMLADELVTMLNEAREANGGPYGRIMLGLLPAPQWLTPETLANLRAAAQGSTP